MSHCLPTYAYRQEADEIDEDEHEDESDTLELEAKARTLLQRLQESPSEISVDLMLRSCKQIPEKTFGARSPAQAVNILHAMCRPDDQEFILRRVATVAMGSVVADLTDSVGFRAPLLIPTTLYPSA